MGMEHFDVLVVGAGLSGICAGHYLKSRCPDRTFAILEARDDLGGTWDLFRYPGVRSDSDMYTLGYSFRPWRRDKAIADGASILAYLRDTARELGIDRHIRYRHQVRAASWSSAEARWSVDVTRDDAEQPVTLTCNFLFLCSGYYSYEAGHDPGFQGQNDFRGRIVHPQHWPDDLEYRGRNVVVIGSGATAVTLVPAMADEAAHVTMLQRSPTYIVSRPEQDRLAARLRRWLPAAAADRAVRWKNVLMGLLFYQLCRRRPQLARRLIRKGVEMELPNGYPVDTDFNPSYNPWDQRLCLVPDSDLFRTIREGKASIVTDHVERMTADGVLTRSGKEIPADVIVTATGLKLVPCGGVDFTVDGEAVEPGSAFSYKGVMLSGVPNLAVCVGYTNASWTLKAELSCLFVCRLLRYMDRRGYAVCTPQVTDPDMAERPLLDLSANYIQRSAHLFPKQGDRHPWLQHQNYLLDLMNLKFGRVNDRALEFGHANTSNRAPLRRSA